MFDVLALHHSAPTTKTRCPASWLEGGQRQLMSGRTAAGGQPAVAGGGWWAAGGRLAGGQRPAGKAAAGVEWGEAKCIFLSGHIKDDV